jgi:integrase/recombinase XerD
MPQSQQAFHVFDLRQAVDRFLDYLVVEAGLSENTILAYRADLNKFVTHLDRKRIDIRKLTPVQIQEFLRSLSVAGLAISSIARHLAAVRMFLKYLYMTAAVDRDVTTLIDSPKKWKNLPNVVHYKQISALLEAPDPEEAAYLRDRAILELLYATGMRVSELVTLNTGSVNPTVGYVRVIGKGRKERIIPVGTAALDALEDYVTMFRPTLVGPDSDDALFLSRTGRPLDRTAAWRIVVKYAERIGMTGRITPHTLRHSFATHMLQGGADLRVVQELLGHADVTTTQIYTHVDRSHLKQIHRRYHPLQ